MRLTKKFVSICRNHLIWRHKFCFMLSMSCVQQLIKRNFVTSSNYPCQTWRVIIQLYFSTHLIANKSNWFSLAQDLDSISKKQSNFTFNCQMLLDKSIPFIRKKKMSELKIIINAQQTINGFAVSHNAYVCKTNSYNSIR